MGRRSPVQEHEILTVPDEPARINVMLRKYGVMGVRSSSKSHSRSKQGMEKSFDWLLD